jgi:hypothetical protein
VGLVARLLTAPLRVVHYGVMAVRGGGHKQDTEEIVFDRAAIQELRHEAAARGARLGHVTDLALQRVLEITHGDVDFAATAMTMEERPEWVIEFVGP